VKHAALALLALSLACAAPPGGVVMPVDGGYVPPKTPASPVTTAGTWRIEGRYVPDAAGPILTWAGSSITFRFQGSSVVIGYHDDTQFGVGACNWYDVIIDGSLQPAVPLATTYLGHDPYPHTWTINVPGGGTGVHEVTLVKRTEEEKGATQFLSFDKALLLLPADPRTRKIEFIGDSLTAGFGNEGSNLVTPYSASFNETRAYPGLVAGHFNAERHTIAASGRGLVRDASGNTAINGNMVDRWLRRREAGNIGYVDPATYWVPWDFSTWQADVVTVNLGTNDYVAAQTSIRSDFATFYRLIRSKYAAAKIVAIMPSQPAGTVRASLRSDIQGAIVDVADAGLSFLEFPEIDPADGYGGAGHPTLKTHQKQANLLVAHIQGLMGWQ
jgi:lysophospholipase L1-like esterase